METDRNAVLIKRAFLRKVIDAATCEINSDEWWRRTMPLVSAMGEFDDLELLRAAHNHQCALISHGNLKEESFKDVQRRAKDTFQDMINILRPWERQDQKETNSDLIEAFKQQFGDPNDPAVREKYERDARMVMEQLKQNEKEAEENKKKLEEFERKLQQNNARRQRGISR